MLGEISHQVFSVSFQTFTGFEIVFMVFKLMWKLLLWKRNVTQWKKRKGNSKVPRTCESRRSKCGGATYRATWLRWGARGLRGKRRAEEKIAEIHKALGFHEVMCGWFFFSFKWKPNINTTLANGLKPHISRKCSCTSFWVWT